MRLSPVIHVLAIAILLMTQSAQAVDVTTTLRVGAADDGLPNPPAMLTYTWSLQSGPSGYASTPSYAVQMVGGPGDSGYTNKVVATIPNAVVGSYVFRVAVSDSMQAATSDVTVQVVANQAPVVSAGPDLTVALSGTATLAGTVSDDGYPASPGVTTATWSRDSGPGTASFANPANAVTTATFSAVGTYVLRLAATDGIRSAFDLVTVTVNPATTPGDLNGSGTVTFEDLALFLASYGKSVGDPGYLAGANLNNLGSSANKVDFEDLSAFLTVYR